jgi:hypothetical protein
MEGSWEGALSGRLFWASRLAAVRGCRLEMLTTWRMASLFRERGEILVF